MATARHVARVLLGLAMVGAGVLHLVRREEFHALVPAWFPLDEDLTVVASGVVEVVIGAAFVALPRHRRTVGLVLALLLVAVFPGNLAMYVEGTDAFGLHSDRARFLRLLVQPLLVLWALYGGGWLARITRRPAPARPHPRPR